MLDRSPCYPFRALIHPLRVCFNISPALVISGFVSFVSPSWVAARTLSEQESMEKGAVAFAMMIWLPRLDAACELHKQGLLAESELPAAYRALYQSYRSENSNPETVKTFSKLMELLKAEPHPGHI